MTVNFRAAADADINLLLELMQEYYELDGIPFDPSEARTALTGLLTDSSLGRILLISCDGTTAGYLVVTFGYSLEFRGRDAFIDELYVRSAYRGQGIGTQALECAEQVCRATGVRALHLEVERKNLAAQAFYRGLGFQEHDRFLMTRWLDTAGSP